jgi:hypothetical protein
VREEEERVLGEKVVMWHGVLVVVMVGWATGSAPARKSILEHGEINCKDESAKELPAEKILYKLTYC